FRVAMNARRAAAKRTEREQRAAVAEPNTPPDLGWRELQTMLDEELQGLPDKYRTPFILCCLEGRSRAEAAAELGWNAGTLSSRIAQARKLLQERLTQRGVMLSVALTAGVLWNQPASAALVQTTLQAATRIASGQAARALAAPSVAALLEASAHTVVSMKTRLALAVLLVASLVGTMVVAVGFSETDSPTREQGNETVGLEDSTHPTNDKKIAKVDRHGDPLPPGAT